MSVPSSPEAHSPAAARGATARAAMLDAAEQIACDSGLGAITLTAVQQAAGQANKSAAAYHFGSRHGLLQAVIARRMGPIDAQRTELLDRTDPHDLLALVNALVRPLAEATLLSDGSRYARFVAQAFIDPTLGELVLGHDSAQSLRRVQALLHDLLEPTLGESKTGLRIAAATGQLVIALALLEGQSGFTITPDLVDDLVASVFGALSALPVDTSPTATQGA